ncbi:hypothetical protein PoMZ_12341, partial [Pyricularia oryzae]
MHQACTTISKPRKEKDREHVGPGWLQIETEECLSVSKLQPSSTLLNPGTGTRFTPTGVASTCSAARRLVKVSDRVVESLHHRASASIGFAGKVHGESGSSGRTHIDADMRIEWLRLQQYSQTRENKKKHFGIWPPKLWFVVTTSWDKDRQEQSVARKSREDNRESYAKHGKAIFFPGDPGQWCQGFSEDVMGLETRRSLGCGPWNIPMELGIGTASED